MMRRMRGPAVLALASMLVACSHTSPYLRDPLPARATPTPGPNQILQRIILIGDAGAPALYGEPVLELLRDTVAGLPSKTVVVFLGDNIYPRGLPEGGTGGRAAAEAALDAQIAAVGNARGIFVPGNHDWDHASAEGLEAVLRQGAYLATRPNVELSPTDGCPGPAVHELQEVRLIALDTQWWLHGEQPKGSDCSVPDSAAASRALADLLKVPDDREVIVVGHHPLRSRGPHDGFYTAAEWIFPSLMADNWMRWVLLPLPILGPVVRWAVRSEQDFRSRGNTSFRRQLAATLSSTPPLAYAAGHEHSLQVFEGDSVASLLLVSGLGSGVKGTPVGDDERTLFAQSRPGFMVLDVMAEEVLLRVFVAGAEEAAYWKVLPRRSVVP